MNSRTSTSRCKKIEMQLQDTKNRIKANDNFIKVTTLMQTRIGRLLIICMISTILVLSLTGAAIAKYAFVIYDGDTQTVVYTSTSLPKAVIEEENIELSPYDEITFSGLENNHAEVTIHRAKRVSITADKNLSVVYIAQGTVSDALEKANIKVKETDLINVALEEQINADMDIAINRVLVEEVIEKSEIPREIMKFPTRTLPNNETKVYRAGKNGIMQTVSKQTRIDGEIVEKIKLTQEVLEKPVTEKLLVGDSKAPVSELISAAPIAVDAKGVPLNYSAKITGKATGYSSRGRKTSLDTGHVAMDTSKFPRGTKLYIKTPGGSYIYGYSVVKDTGIAVKNGTLLVDLFFDSYEESCNFGVKTVDVYVLE